MVLIKKIIQRCSGRNCLAFMALLAVSQPGSQLAAQGDFQQDPVEAQRLYGLLYEAAMADSIISPEEARILQALQEALGIHEDVAAEAFGEPSIRPLPPTLDQSGRWTLIAQNMVWGMGLYGWGIPYILDVSDPKWYVGGEMLSLSATFALTWKYTGNMHLPEARSQLQRYGGLVGLRYGWALSGLAGLDKIGEGDSNLRGHVALLMASVPAGIYLGDRYYRRWQPSTGHAYALALHGAMSVRLLRSGYGKIVPPPPEPEEQFMLPGESWEDYERDHDAWEKDIYEWRRVARVVEIAGYPLGMWLERKVYGQRQYSLGDALMLYLGWTGFMFYGVMIGDLMNLDMEATVPLLSSAMGAGGVVLMDRYIQGADYSFGQWAMMSLGSVAGGTFGIGVGIITEAEGDFFHVAFIGGSLGGFFLTRMVIEPATEGLSYHREHDGLKTHLTFQPVYDGNRIRPGVGFELNW